MNDFAEFVDKILNSPWIAFLVAVWLLVNMNKQNKEQIAAMQESHREEMKGMQRVLEKLNTSIRELLDEWRKV